MAGVYKAFVPVGKKGSVIREHIKFAVFVLLEILHSVFIALGLVVIGGDGTLRGAKDLSDNFGVKVMGIPDKFIEHGTPEELYRVCGMDKDSVLSSILKFKEL